MNAITNDLRTWPAEDLLVLARAAGMLWDSTGRNDPLDVLSEAQRALLDRAAGAYLTTKQDSYPEDYEGSQDGDGFIVLDDGRYFASLGREGGFTPDGQPRNGYPDPDVAAYELAGLMAEHRENPDSWMCGEHGPTEREYGSEVDKHLNADIDGLLPLEGVVYEPGTEVRWDDSTWEVRRDYGELGVWLVIPVDPDAGRDHLVPHELIERADLLSEARGWIADNQWANIAEDDIADLSDEQVRRGIEAHYAGGWAQFARAGGEQEQPS